MWLLNFILWLILDYPSVAFLVFQKKTTTVKS
ncbi:hypothetical protein SCB49_03504 [unidentified eubacterium SCB49]|nr:hypothetical protein SCB49_03504 [unidentified eubacterium SCB49]